MTVNFRTSGAWGAGLGRNLTPAEVDGNFYDLKLRVEEIEDNPPAAIGISNITSNGSQLMVYLEDGTSFGPFSLPIAAFRSRGNWAASIAYFANDFVVAAGYGVYLVLTDHTSGSTFNENLQGADGDVYQLLSPNHPSVISTKTAASYEPGQTDANKYLRCTNAAGCVITLVHGFPVGTEMTFRQCHATGQLSFTTGDTGGLINSVTGKDDGTDRQGAVVHVKCVSVDGEWDIWGDLSDVTA